MLRPSTIFGSPDDLLAASRPGRAATAPPSLHALILSVVLFGCCYGAVMGCFGGIHGQRLEQVLFSAVKVPMLLLVAFVLSLPTFWVLNALMGLADDFHLALRCLLSTQAGLTVILASLAPFTAVWYASFTDYHAAMTFNAAMFAIASFAGQWHLRRCYAALIARDPRHRWLVRVWLLIYAFVGIQMGWVLRPFLGDPNLPTSFFRKDGWGNAYVELAKLLWLGLMGR